MEGCSRLYSSILSQTDCVATRGFEPKTHKHYFEFKKEFRVENLYNNSKKLPPMARGLIVPDS
jgi:hypothetical protein